LVVNTSSSNATCFGSNNGSANIIASGGTGVYNYSWFPGGYTVPNVNNLGAGTYTVTTTDPNTSCTNITTVSISQPADFALTTSSTNSTCGNPNGSATVSVNGTSTYAYYWNSTPSQNTPVAANLSPGQYTVTVTNNASCTKTGTVTVTSIDNLNADFSASTLTGEAPLNIFFTNNSIGATSYIWSFGDSETSILTDPSHVLTSTGTFTVILVSSNSTCLDTAQVTVFIDEHLQYFIPNVFTPNGDMDNDIFTLNGSGMKSFSGNIFNRWGTKVFEWNDPKGGWNGENQPDGVYYYTIEFMNNSGELKSLTGFITLLR
jgi:gliding motility-associated-like protein